MRSSMPKKPCSPAQTGPRPTDAVGLFSSFLLFFYLFLTRQTVARALLLLHQPVQAFEAAVRAVACGTEPDVESRQLLTELLQLCALAGEPDSVVPPVQGGPLPPLACALCGERLQRPVTHICGCSVDWHCAEREARCPHCQEPWLLADYKPNFCLSALLDAMPDASHRHETEKEKKKEKGTENRIKFGHLQEDAQ